MFNKFYYIFISLFLLLLSNELIGQIAYECEYTIRKAENALQDSIVIEVFISNSGTTTFVLGTSIFTIEANKEIDVSKPSKIADGPWDDGIDATNYGDITFVGKRKAYEGIKYVGIQINKIQNDGLIVPNETTLLGSFRLPIKSTGGYSAVVWHMSGVNSVVVTDVNGTDITANGSFIDPPPIQLPVELTSFTAFVKESKVLLNWHTETEVNNYGFEVQRSFTANEWEVIGFVEGHGNSNSPKEYEFIDDLSSLADFSQIDSLKYRLKQIDLDGKFEYYNLTVSVDLRNITGIDDEIIPVKFELFQNYPNPFNPVTKIQFDLKEQGDVELSVYNVLGEKIIALVNESLGTGLHVVDFNANNLPSGIYYYQLQVHTSESGTGYSAIKKMTLLK